MSQYGYKLDQSYNPNHDIVYRLFATYFDNPTLYKIDDRENHSIYAVRIYCLLGAEYRYLMAIVDIDSNAKNTSYPLSSLRWKALQTRTLTEYHEIPTVTYNIKRKEPFNSPITVKNRSKTHTEYTHDTYPFTVTLLHKPNSSEYEYPNKGTITTSLETFSTIITV